MLTLYPLARTLHATMMLHNAMANTTGNGKCFRLGYGSSVQVEVLNFKHNDVPMDTQRTQNIDEHLYRLAG